MGGWLAVRELNKLTKSGKLNKLKNGTQPLGLGGGPRSDKLAGWLVVWLAVWALKRLQKLANVKKGTQPSRLGCGSRSDRRLADCLGSKQVKKVRKVKQVQKV